jgi:hypothetical protein
MTRLTDERLALIRDSVRRGLNAPSTLHHFVDDLLAHIDALERNNKYLLEVDAAAAHDIDMYTDQIRAQQERIDALEAERAEMTEEWAIRTAGGVVLRADTPGEAELLLRRDERLMRRRAYYTPWVPVQETDRG